jgi:hypothetical protein
MNTRNVCQNRSDVASHVRPALSWRIVLAAGLLAALPFAHGAGIQDGFYFLSDDTSVPLVSDQDGDAIRLGARQDVKDINVYQAKILSQDNANSRFKVDLTILNDTEQQIGALVVGGKVFAREGARNHDFGFTFFGAKNATNISRFLNAPVTYRKHPGYNLAVSFSPSKRTYEVGEQVRVTMCLENVGPTPFRFKVGGEHFGPFDDQYTFQAWLGGRRVDNNRDGKNLGGGGGVGTKLLKPGESLTNSVVLSSWFAFDAPGTYSIRGSYLMSFCPVEQADFLVLLRDGPIWQDYATGDFNVTITPAQTH